MDGLRACVTMNKNPTGEGNNTSGKFHSRLRRAVMLNLEPTATRDIEKKGNEALGLLTTR